MAMLGAALLLLLAATPLLVTTQAQGADISGTATSIADAVAADTKIALIGANSRINCALNSADDKDYFKITTTRDGVLSVNATRPGGGTNNKAILYTASGNAVSFHTSSTDTTGFTEHAHTKHPWQLNFRRTVAAGTYYVEVQRGGGTTDIGQYTLHSSLRENDYSARVTNLVTDLPCVAPKIVDCDVRLRWDWDIPQDVERHLRLEEGRSIIQVVYTDDPNYVMNEPRCTSNEKKQPAPPPTFSRHGDEDHFYVVPDVDQYLHTVAGFDPSRSAKIRVTKHAFFLAGYGCGNDQHFAYVGGAIAADPFPFMEIFRPANEGRAPYDQEITTIVDINSYSAWLTTWWHTWQPIRLKLEKKSGNRVGVNWVTHSPAVTRPPRPSTRTTPATVLITGLASCLGWAGANARGTSDRNLRPKSSRGSTAAATSRRAGATGE